MSADNFLEVDGITVQFGGLTAVNQLSFNVKQGSIHALIGPNGAGKSTTFNCISRYYQPTAGRIRLQGQDISQLPPERMAGLGVARTFQNLELFGDLSVRENVLLGCHSHSTKTLSGLLRRPNGETNDLVDSLLERVGLTSDRETRAKELDFGHQKLLEIARALALKPRLLLLDEPAAGLRNRDIESLDKLLTELVDKDGITVLLVEHVMQLVMSISHQITVMSFGQKIAEGTPAEVSKDERVIEAYLGKGAMFLELRNISASYGAIQALSNVSLNVPQGAIVALLGSNGAGKSSTLNSICKLIEPSGGEVLFDGKSIHKLKSDDIVRQGLVQVPEGREVFKDMSVEENLELGAFVRAKAKDLAENFERVYAMFPRLKERRAQRASTLSGGEQQMLAIGRALMSNPRMILLDEPSMGLSPLLVEQIFETITRLNREQGLTILLVEQDVRLALTVASYAYILENGEVTLQGPSEQLINDPAVRRAYLGA